MEQALKLAQARQKEEQIRNMATLAKAEKAEIMEKGLRGHFADDENQSRNTKQDDSKEKA